MNIVKDAALYLLGELFSKSVPFLLLPYLTRQLGSEGFGTLAYYQSLLALAMIFIGMNQDGAVARYIYRYGDRSIGAAVVGGAIFSCMATSVAAIVALAAGASALAVIALAAMLQSLLNVQLVVRQFQKKVGSYVLLQIANGVASMVLTVTLFSLLGESAMTRIVAIVASTLICAGAAAIAIAATGVRFRYSLQRYKKALLFVLSFGAPLIFHHLSFWVRGQFDRIILFERFDSSVLGYYSAGFQLAQVFLVLVMAANKAVVPHFFDGIKAGRIDRYVLRRLFLLSFVTIAVPPVAALLIPSQFYELVLGQGFAEAKVFCVFFLLTNALAIPYLVLTNWIFYTGLTRYLSLANVLSALAYLLGIKLLLDQGIQWVPLASVVSSATLIAVLYLIMFHIKPEQVFSSVRPANADRQRG